MKNQTDCAERWIALFIKAERLLTPVRFKHWLMGVGFGTYEERYRVGKVLLKRMQWTNAVRHKELEDGIDEVCSFSSRPLNAISPDAGGAPNPRGVR